MYEGPAIAKQQPVINDKVRIIHTCATTCIHVPVLERKAPDQNNRKLRCRSARNISPTSRLRRCSSSSSVGIIKLIPLLDVRAKVAQTSVCDSTLPIMRCTHATH